MLMLALPLDTLFSVLQLVPLSTPPTPAAPRNCICNVLPIKTFKTAKSADTQSPAAAPPVCTRVSENVPAPSFDLSLVLLSSINLPQWQTIKTDDCNPHEEGKKTATRFLAQSSNHSTLHRHDLTAVGGVGGVWGGIVLHLHARLISLFCII